MASPIDAENLAPSPIPTTDAPPTLDDWMEKARPLNEGVSERDLHRYWAAQYSTTDPKSLPTYESWLPQAKPLNPTVSESRLHEYWGEQYGDFGAREKETPSPGFLGTAEDIGIGVAKGVVGLGRSIVGLSDLVAGGQVGKGLEYLGADLPKWTAWLTSKQSEAQQESDKAVADADGFIDTAVAYLQNPRSLAAGIAESVPGFGAMGYVAKKAAVSIFERAALEYGGVKTAAGIAAGRAAVHEQAGKLLWVGAGVEGSLSAGSTAETAREAGRDYSDYLLPSLATGVGVAGFGRLGGAVVGGSIEQAAGLGAAGIVGNLGNRVAKSIFSEGVLEEMPQSALEKVFENVALGKDWRSGVSEAAASGLVVGGVFGGVVGALRKGEAPKATLIPPPDAPLPPSDAPLPPSDAPLPPSDAPPAAYTAYDTARDAAYAIYKNSSNTAEDRAAYDQALKSAASTLQAEGGTSPSDSGDFARLAAINADQVIAQQRQNLQDLAAQRKAAVSTYVATHNTASLQDIAQTVADPSTSIDESIQAMDAVVNRLNVRQAIFASTTLSNLEKVNALLAAPELPPVKPPTATPVPVLPMPTPARSVEVPSNVPPPLAVPSNVLPAPTGLIAVPSSRPLPTYTDAPKPTMVEQNAIQVDTRLQARQAILDRTDLTDFEKTTLLRDVPELPPIKTRLSAPDMNLVVPSNVPLPTDVPSNVAPPSTGLVVVDPMRRRQTPPKEAPSETVTELIRESLMTSADTAEVAKTAERESKRLADRTRETTRTVGLLTFDDIVQVADEQGLTAKPLARLVQSLTGRTTLEDLSPAQLQTVAQALHVTSATAKLRQATIAATEAALAATTVGPLNPRYKALKATAAKLEQARLAIQATLPMGSSSQAQKQELLAVSVPSEKYRALSKSTREIFEGLWRDSLAGDVAAIASLKRLITNKNMNVVFKNELARRSGLTLPTGSAQQEMLIDRYFASPTTLAEAAPVTPSTERERLGLKRERRTEGPIPLLTAGPTPAPRIPILAAGEKASPVPIVGQGKASQKLVPVSRRKKAAAAAAAAAAAPDTTPRFSRTAGVPQDAPSPQDAKPEPISVEVRNQQLVDDLNEGFLRAEGVENGFQLSTNGDQGIINAFLQVFGVTVVPITPTSLQSEGFYGVQYNGTLFVVVGPDAGGFAQVAGHELLHFIRKTDPALYEWFSEQAETYLRGSAIPEYAERLRKAGANVYEEGAVDIREEILADFVGDALADPEFLAQMADKNPSRFRQFLTAITDWLNTVLTKLTSYNLKSSQYFTDVQGLRTHLVDVLDAFAAGQSEKIYDVADAPTPRTGKIIPLSDVPPANAEEAKALLYHDVNGIYPYLSMGKLGIKVEVLKYAVKTDGKYGNDSTTGLPLNANGTVTLYYHTTNADAQATSISKTLRSTEASPDRVYLTNESNGTIVKQTPGGMTQRIDGASVLVQVDPSLLQVDNEYENGRKDFFIPTREGQAFFRRLQLFALQSRRDEPIPKATKFADLQSAMKLSIDKFEGQSKGEQRLKMAEVKAVLSKEFNLGTNLLTTNGKLQKTAKSGEKYKGKPVASFGLGLASAQRLDDTTGTCAVHANCDPYCLGDRSGGNALYGGVLRNLAGVENNGFFIDYARARDGDTVTIQDQRAFTAPTTERLIMIETPTSKLQKELEIDSTARRAGPRLAQFLKTSALIVRPDATVLALSAQIKREEAKATANGQQLAIRLNVTSDIPGRYYVPLMLRFPQVQFYDYTKLLGNKSLAPNHHLTYSSNGASQTINGKPLYNANQTWAKERALLDSGFNVAMAFVGKTDLPKFLFDEETGRTYTVISGDKYDARFLDPKAANGIGMIVALGNKDDAMVRQNKRKAKMELRHAAPLPVVMKAIAATTAANPQTVSSQKTAVSQVAGIVRLVEKAHTWVAGSRNLDIGGGPYEATTNALRAKGVTNVVYDKYNRSAAHNDAVVAQFGAGTLTQPAFKEANYRPEVSAWARTQFGDRTAPNGSAVWQNFTQWFGDSKVVDADGKPLVVYHGYAGRKYNVFKDKYFGKHNDNDLSKTGFFFTPDRTTAEDYAYQAAWNIAPEDKEFTGKGQQIHEVYLSLQNPLEIDGSQFGSMRDETTRLAGVVKKAKDDGYDAVILRGWEDGSGKHDQYIAFNPTQIKSATGNSGNFDSTNQSILNQPARDRSVDEIHAFATANQIAWDDDPAFMDFTKSVTGKRKIDALTQPERNRLYAALESRVEAKAPATRGFDTATLSNVLNVIQEKRFQLEALRVAQAGLKAGGSLYVTVWKGNETGQGGVTPRGFQHNKPLAAYLETVKMVFPNAVVHGSMIMATKGAATASADIRFKRRDVAPDVNSPKTEMDTGTIDPSMERSRLQNLAVSLRPPFLTTLTLQQLADVYGGFASTYNSVVQTMRASFSYLTEAADVPIRNWDALPIEDADAMARVMEQARQEGFDPDRLAANAREVVSTNKQITLKTRAVRPVQPKNDAQLALVRQFAALSDPAKAVYREVRDFYTVLADQRMEAITQRIQRMGGTEANKKAILDKIREEYELTVQGAYFPYSRFGDHLVIAKKMIDGKEDRVVSAFEAPAEAASFAVMMKAQGYTVKRTVASQYSRDQAGAASTILEEVYTLIDTLTDEGHDVGTRSARETLKDSINQIALNALPDLSYAKHFIHAKKVKGFSTDALRAFSHSGLHGAHHISRINHADALTGALRDFDRQIALTETNDTSEARQVYNEIVKRHDYLMNPNTSPVAAQLGQLGFVMSLGGVVAASVTNMTQVPLISYPWLGARYGYGKSAKALMQAYHDFFDPKTLNKDTVFNAAKSLNLTADERTFLLIAIEAGKIDVTQTMDLAGVASQDNLSRKAKAVGTVQDKIMRMLAFSFHIPEVMNRQVTALAAYRLAKTAMLQNRGTNTDEQIERHARVQGIKSLDDTHFIYTAENRPRIMQGNVMRVLTMFKQYGQAVVFTYGQAARLWLERNKPDGMTPEQEREERRVARSQLLSMLSFQFAAAGALGLPFVGSIVGLLTAAANGFGDDDEDKDWQAEFRKSLAASIGKNSAEVVAHGLSRVTPYDMAGRLGQESLFFRTPSREREGRAAFTDWALSLGGPVTGYGLNAWLGIPDVLKGIKDLDAGHFLRGTEELTPAMVRNAVKAFRYELEGGIRTRDHYKQMDVTFAEELGQFFGFAPRRGAEMYEGVTDIKNAEHRLAMRRNDLLDQYALARSEANSVKLQGTIADIREFNGRHPNMRISGDTIMRSLRGRSKREQLMSEGIYLPRNRAFLRQEGSYANY